MLYDVDGTICILFDIFMSYVSLNCVFGPFTLRLLFLIVRLDSMCIVVLFFMIQQINQPVNSELWFGFFKKYHNCKTNQPINWKSINLHYLQTYYIVCQYMQMKPEHCTLKCNAIKFHGDVYGVCNLYC